MESPPQISHQCTIEPGLKGPILAIILFEVCAIFIRSFAAMGLQETGLSPSVSKDLSWMLIPVVLGGLMVPILTANWYALKSQFRLRPPDDTLGAHVHRPGCDVSIGLLELVNQYRQLSTFFIPRSGRYCKPGICFSLSEHIGLIVNGRRFCIADANRGGNCQPRIFPAGAIT